MGWLCFLPNAPYVVTDLLHLRPRPPVPLWFDVLLLASAAVTGLVAGALSLREMEAAMRGRIGSTWTAVALWVAILAAGFGIYLGRFERWNSWDLVLHPLDVLRSAYEALGPRAVTVSLSCSGLLAIAFLATGRAHRIAADDSAGSGVRSASR